jgi:YbbR domain-containing protein
MRRERERDRTRRTRPEQTPPPVEPPRVEAEHRLSRAVLHWLKGAFAANAALKFVALVLSLTVFILVHADDQAVAGGTVDVSYKLPKDRVLLSERIDQVRVTVKGSRRRIKRFHREDVDPINIDLSNMTKGEVFFQPEMIGLPEGLELVSITPASMPVEFEDRAVKVVPVAVDTNGTPARGYKVDAVSVRPSEVRISGAASLVAETRSVRTAELDLAGHSKSFLETVRLAPPGSLDIDGAPMVEVEVTLGEEQGSRELSLPVAVRPGNGVTAEQVAKLAAEPGQVRVVLRGSVLVIDALKPEHIAAFVRVRASALTATGDRTAEVRVEPTLPGIAFEISPAEVSLRPTP